MVSQPPQDTPFGLQANVAAGLAYLFGVIGGIVMLVGGGSNRFVKWAAAQSIVLWVAYFIVQWILARLFFSFMFGIAGPLVLLVDLVGFALWLWTFITAFQGKEVRVPVIADLTQNIFKSVLA